VLPNAADYKAMALLEDWEDWDDWDDREAAIGYTEGQAVGLEEVGNTSVQPSTSTSITSQPALAVRLSPVKPKEWAPLRASQLEDVSNLEDALLSQLYNSQDSIWQQDFDFLEEQDQEASTAQDTAQEDIELSN
jgi:hypothetical protein